MQSVSAFVVDLDKMKSPIRNWPACAILLVLFVVCVCGAHWPHTPFPAPIYFICKAKRVKIPLKPCLLHRVVVKKKQPKKNHLGFLKKAHLKKTIKPTKQPTFYFFEKIYLRSKK